MSDIETARVKCRLGTQGDRNYQYLIGFCSVACVQTTNATTEMPAILALLRVLPPFFSETCKQIRLPVGQIPAHHWTEIR